MHAFSWHLGTCPSSSVNANWGFGVLGLLALGVACSGEVPDPRVNRGSGGEGGASIADDVVPDPAPETTGGAMGVGDAYGPAGPPPTETGTGGTPGAGAVEFPVPAKPAAPCTQWADPWVPPVSRVGRVVCSSRTQLSAAHQGRKSWLLASPADSGPGRLYAFADGATSEYPLNVAVTGVLQRSGEDFPAVVARSSGTAGSSTTLYRGLPNAIDAHTVTSEAEVGLSVGLGSVAWMTVTRQGSGYDVVLNQSDVFGGAPSATRSFTGLSRFPQWIPGAAVPTAVINDTAQYSLLDLAGRTPVELSANLALTTWLPEGSPWVAGLVESPTRAGQGPTDQWRTLAVVGTSEEHRTQQFATLSGYAPEQAVAAARIAPTDPLYQPAPILTFRSGYVKGEVTEPSAKHCIPADPSLACSTAVLDERQSQSVNWALARDSKGVPWAIAGVVTEDRLTQPQYGYQGERCACNVVHSVQNVTVELRLFRLAFPTTERTIVLAEKVIGRHKLTLDMDGAQGTLAELNDEAYGTAALWRIDLDAL